jgi:mRNA interferase ChpB
VDQRTGCWTGIDLKRGEIYFVSLDPAFGHEQQGTRPVLIISSNSLNNLTRLPVAVPITSGGTFARTTGYAVSLMGAGTKTVGIARCDQPRVVDLTARKAQKVETLTGPILDEILLRTASIFD